MPCPIFLLARLVSIQEGLYPGGLSPRILCPERPLSRESLSGRLCTGGSLSKGSLSRVVSIQGVSVQGVSLHGFSVLGVSIQRGLCPEGSLSGGWVFVQGDSNRETPPTVKSGRDGGVMQAQNVSEVGVDKIN